MLDGCCADYGANWAHGLNASEYADMKDMMDLVSRAAKKQFVTSKSTKFSALEHSAVWIILKQFDLIENLGDREKDIAEKSASKPPTDPFLLKVLSLVQLCRKMLETGRTKEDIGVAMDKLRVIKRQWLRENAAVLVTTISKIGESAVTDVNPAWTVCEDSQCVSVHNITIWLAAFSNIPRYMIGDIASLGPFCDDKDYNSFAEVRKDSLLAKELKRGRPSASMTISGRAGRRAVTLPSTLCYGDELRSNIKDHPYTKDIIAFHQSVFKSSSSRCPHLFINTGAGMESLLGHRQSATNVKLMQFTRSYMEEYEDTVNHFKMSDIAIISPWVMQDLTWKKELGQMGEDHLLIVETVHGMIGGEATVVILELARTENLGFLNMQGMWNVALSRSKAATIIIANHSTLQLVRGHMTGFYGQIVAWFKNMVRMWTGQRISLWSNHGCTPELLMGDYVCKNQ